MVQDRRRVRDRAPVHGRDRSAERAIARDLGVSVAELYRLLAPARGRDQAETAPLVKLGPGGEYVREVRK